MTLQHLHSDETAEARAVSAALIAGRLPEATLAMPTQVIERAPAARAQWRGLWAGVAGQART